MVTLADIQKNEDIKALISAATAIWRRWASPSTARATSAMSAGRQRVFWQR